MSTILCVAEKPSVATGLARLLGTRIDAGAVERKQRLPVHEVRVQFQGKSVVFRVTSVAGHVFSLDFVGEAQKWTSDPTALFSAAVVKKQTDRKVVKHLESEARGCDAVMLWLDCDREGENICFEVLDVVIPHLRGAKAVYRAKFSALSEVDIRRALANLVKPNENEAKAVDCRQILDLKIGAAWTRFQTTYFDQKYGDLNSRLISFGPCQTPTLGFVVARQDEINSFQSEPFWFIAAVADCNQVPIELTWSRGRLFSKNAVLAMKGQIGGEKSALCVSVASKRKKKPRPTGLNTVELLRVASRRFGISPHQTMHWVEQLYIGGYISYPRTESTAYPDSFDFVSVLQPHAKHEDWGAFVASLFEVGIVPPKAGSDHGDHPPITPMRVATEKELGAQYCIYEYVARHFIASVSPDCEYDKIQTKWQIGSEFFSSSTIELKNAGFALVLPSEMIRSTVLSCAPVAGKRYNITKLEVEEGATQPPDNLTESDLITLMEKNKIGTDASNPSHIHNIVERNFCRVSGQGRHLVPTRLGIVLIHGIARIDSQLCKPQIRSEMENYIDEIANGKARFEEVLERVLNIFVDKFNYFVANIARMDELFEASFSSIVTTTGASKPLSKCGRCRRYMRLIHKTPMWLFCEMCNETFSLPPNGSVRLFQEQVCPLDNYELVVWRSGTGETAKTQIVCPYCYNHPPMVPIEEAPVGFKGMACSQCTIPHCSFSLANLAVCPCDAEGCSGTMILDLISAPKWKMACSTCSAAVMLPGAAKKISLTQDPCEECGAMKLRIDFNKNDVPAALGGKTTLHDGCCFCDQIISSKCHEGKTKTTHGRRKYGGGKKGGGKRGGGRGGGGKGGRADAKLSFNRFRIHSWR